MCFVSVYAARWTGWLWLIKFYCSLGEHIEYTFDIRRQIQDSRSLCFSTLSYVMVAARVGIYIFVIICLLTFTVR